jgi:hypothetical protein
MPHPKNRLKLTGDTHLPDVGDEEPDTMDMEPGADFDAVPPAAIRPAMAAQPMTRHRYRRGMGNLTRTFALLALGLVLLRLFR